MFAIIRAGGKQYKVEAGDTVRVEKIEKKLGDQFNLAEVLMVGGDKTFVGATSRLINAPCNSRCHSPSESSEDHRFQKETSSGLPPYARSPSALHGALHPVDHDA